MHKSPAPPAPKMPWLERLFAPLHAFLQRRRLQPIRDPGALRDFVRTRASYVAQMTLYGYLRTRAGVRFPELFNNDEFVASVNIARWHVWLACLSDLAAYMGGLLRRAGQADADVGRVMQKAVAEILAETGVPADAGPEYVAHADRVRTRIALCHWAAQADGDGPFTESPGALVYWAPIVEELKALDEEIVRNSVRFRWNEIRAQARRALDAPAIMGAAPSS
jgi:hypothetical protein